MQTLVTVIHVITCVLLVLVVLVQSGKGAEISASFSGSSQTVFGSSGGANFFTHFTQAAAGIFMATSLILTVMGGQARKSLFETGAATQSQNPLKQAPPVSAPAKGGNMAAPVAPQKPVTK